MDKLWIEAAMINYQKENQIFKVSKIEVEGGVPKGDNNASVIVRGKLELVLGSGRKTTKSVIIKEKHVGKKGEILDKINPFKVETKAYTDILRPMEYIMEELEDHRDKFWCEMYGFKPFNMIMFENLSPKGFVVAERRNALNMDHSKLVLDALGRFHALSKILMKRGIFTENDLSPYYFFTGWEMTEKMFSVGMKQLSQLMIEKWPSDMKEVAERIAKQESIIIKRFKELQYSDDENLEFKVINHGDPWTCNMMFRYDEKTNAPINFKLLDFQICHVNSYIFDVLYFLYTSVQPNLRRQNLKQLYKIYWESMSFNLKKFGYTDKIPSYNDVLKEAEKKDYFAFAILALYYPGMTADLEQPYDLEKATGESGGSFVDDRALIAQNFIEQCSEDFKNFAKKGVI